MNVATLDLPFANFPSVEDSIGRRIKWALATLIVLGSFTSALFLGWGWDGLLQLFSHPARATLLVAAMLQLAFSVAQARPLVSSRERTQSQFTRFVFWALVVASLLMVASSAFWDRRILLVLPGEDLTRYIGLALFLAGLAVNAWQRTSSEAWRVEVRIANRRRNWKDLFCLFGRSVQPSLIMMVAGLPMVFLSKLGLAGAACFAILSIVRAVCAVRAVCRNERFAEPRLRAA